MIEGPNQRYQIATSAFHCILSGSLNEAAYNTYRAGVMEIKMQALLVAGCNYSLIKYIFFLTLDRTLDFLSFIRQPVDFFSKIFYSCNQTNNALNHYRGPAEGWTPVIECRRCRFFNVTLLGIYSLGANVVPCEVRAESKHLV